jgi:hypothetical protein
MKPKTTAVILVCALALLCIAGTKMSRLTRTRSLQETSRFYVVTQAVDGKFYSRYILAPDLATNLGPWITNQGVGSGAGDVTTSQLLVVSNQVQVVSNALNTDVNAKIGNAHGLGTNTSLHGSVTNNGSTVRNGRL